MSPAPRVRRRLRLMMAVGLALLLFLGGNALLLRLAWIGGPGAPRPGPPYRTVSVPAGMTFRALVDTLAARRLVRHAVILRAAARLGRHDRRLRAGIYTVPAGLSPRDLLALFTEGKAVLVRVTLPEGEEAEASADRVAAGVGCDAGRFLAAADSIARADLSGRRFLGDPAHAGRLEGVDRAGPGPGGRPRHWCEGYLGPDTYLFAPGTPARAAAAAIVNLGVARAEQVARDAGPHVAALGLSPHDLVTLASIVEAEARRPEERPLIAAVYVNRLRAGWCLEADPTVAFLLRKKGERLYYKDLEADSPYNTYLHPGLPPGPIDSPGASALSAAAHPDPTCDALWFVADGEGGHVFSRTRAEHERAVQAYRLRRDHPAP